MNVLFKYKKLIVDDHGLKKVFVSMDGESWILLEEEYQLVDNAGLNTKCTAEEQP